MKDFVLDLETLAITDSAVILCVACVSVDFTQDFEFVDLVENAFFRKLDVRSQATELGRYVDPSTLSWWKTQPDELRKYCFNPAADDVPLLKALQDLNDYFKAEEFDERRSVVWTRGAFDSNIIQHACKNTPGAPTLFSYNRVRDVRTAIDILTGSNNGYCHTSKPMGVIAKHDPRHDIAADAMRLKYWLPEE